MALSSHPLCTSRCTSLRAMNTSIDNLDDIAYDGDGDTSEEEAESAPESRRSLAEYVI